MTITGDQLAVSPVSVRTELCVILSKEPVSVLQGLLDATVRTCVQLGPLGKVVCSGASVGLEEPAIKQLENVYVGMDLLGPCKYLTSLHEWKNNFYSFPKIFLFFWQTKSRLLEKHRLSYIKMIKIMMMVINEVINRLRWWIQWAIK